MFLKLPVTRGPLLFFCELLKFPEIPITRALVLTILQPNCLNQFVQVTQIPHITSNQGSFSFLFIL